MANGLLSTLQNPEHLEAIDVKRLRCLAKIAWPFSLALRNY
jgi:hypothetical protein